MFAVKVRTPATAKNMKNFFITVFVCLILIDNVLNSYLSLWLHRGHKTFYKTVAIY